ncbi:MAG: hypothetical protein K8R54_19775 [Bacteroidales bacterium]|nr:hypothetical protein [Bacteroidales bacterium]
MKRTYHTNLLIKYKLGALDIDTINKIIAQKDVIFSNSITCPELVSGIEAVNKRIKYDFLFSC